MKYLTIKNGFIAAGLANILGIMTFSRFFSNEVLIQADPVVMSEFGIVMIVVWGLAYLSVAGSFDKNRWIVGVFALEKLVYVIAWVNWLGNNELSAVFQKDMMAGIFYSMYGPNDLIFMIFFAWVFFKVKS